ncbi:MAG: DUF5809 family protein [Haloferacaceae archaeon]
MHTEGVFSPETLEEAREAFETVGPAAQTAVSETARSMSFDREEYRERVTSDVVETARDAIFASLLSVTVGDAEAFDAWCDEHPDYEVHTIGSENVSRVVWHAAPFEEAVVAATFEHEEDAAVATLRRQAFGRLYRPHFRDD